MGAPTPGLSQPVTRSGYPLGEETLHLRPIADRHDNNIMCALEATNGQCLAIMRPLTQLSPITRATDDLEFEIVRPDYAPLFRLTRYGGSSGHIVELRDQSGSDLGRLRQTNSVWQQVRTQRMNLAIEFGNQRLGHTQVNTSAFKRTNAKVHEPVYDATETAVAHVDRQWHTYTGSLHPQFDYTITCAAPSTHPLPTLTLAIALTHYIYDKIMTGGPLRKQSWTWWRN